MSERCENPECETSQVRFLYNENNKAVYKCCFTCHSSRAVKKAYNQEKVTGKFEEFQNFRDAYYKNLWNDARQKNNERIALSCDSSFYDSPEWRKLRYEALLKLGRTCLCCGGKPPKVELHVDHIKPRSLYPELALDMENLQILCADCNKGKSNRDESDFRPSGGDAA